MPNYDMSETACIERREQYERIDRIDKAIELLADTCEELIKRQDRFKEMLKLLQQMSEINRESIAVLEEEVRCLKQESSQQ
jgi:hypothetical protein